MQKTVVFRSKKSARLRIKLAESVVQGYRADGKPIYSNKAIYAEFDNMVCVLDPEIADQAFKIEKLRSHPGCNVDFKEVGADEKTDKKSSVVKFSAATLNSMNKQELTDVAVSLKLDVIDGVDTKQSIVKSILEAYENL